MPDNPIANLPFVTMRLGRPTSLWVVTPVGKWDADQETGIAYARALCDLMRDTDQPQLLALVVKAMPAPPDWTGIEAGFFHFIACAARRS